jgi:hypothetical protein
MLELSRPGDNKTTIQLLRMKTKLLPVSLSDLFGGASPTPRSLSYITQPYLVSTTQRSS